MVKHLSAESKQARTFRGWFALTQAEQREKKRKEIEARTAAGLGDPGPTQEEVSPSPFAAGRWRDDSTKYKRCRARMNVSDS